MRLLDEPNGSFEGVELESVPLRERKIVPHARVLYLGGFSPGPGLPSPLLDDGFDVIVPNMPYGCRDHLRNPYAMGLVLLFCAFCAFCIKMANNVHAGVLIAGVVGVAAAGWWLKRRAVAWCIEACVQAHHCAIQTHKPDTVVGYSWGGGVAVELLRRGYWSGATLLLAPAGYQMWRHAGLPAPTLEKGGVPETARILTVQGADDAVVSVKDVESMYENACRFQCRLLVARGEGHALVHTCTKEALRDWVIFLNDAVRQGRLASDGGVSPASLSPTRPRRRSSSGGEGWSGPSTPVTARAALSGTAKGVEAATDSTGKLLPPA